MRRAVNPNAEVADGAEIGRGPRIAVTGVVETDDFRDPVLEGGAFLEEAGAGAAAEDRTELDGKVLVLPGGLAVVRAGDLVAAEGGAPTLITFGETAGYSWIVLSPEDTKNVTPVPVKL